MLFDSQVLAYTGVAVLLTLSPGADTALVIRSVLARGRAAGILTTLGICCGCLTHGVLSALGVSLIVAKSATAFTAIKWAGAAYLVYLGMRSLRGGPAVTPEQGPAPGRRSFLEGLFTNLLNPKVIVFYLAFLPQFIRPGDPVLAKSILLAGIHAVLGFLWLATVSVLLSRVRPWLSRPRVQRRLEAVTGVALIGFGARLALDRR